MSGLEEIQYGEIIDAICPECGDHIVYSDYWCYYMEMCLECCPECTSYERT